MNIRMIMGQEGKKGGGRKNTSISGSLDKEFLSAE